jgi:hypothetical protein
MTVIGPERDRARPDNPDAAVEWAAIRDNARMNAAILRLPRKRVMKGSFHGRGPQRGLDGRGAASSLSQEEGAQRLKGECKNTRKLID